MLVEGSAVLCVARCWQAMGDFAAARPLFERAFRIDEAVFGPNHPDVARDLHNQAALLRLTGESAKARMLYERGRRILLADEAVNGDLDGEGRRALQRSAMVALRDYVGLLAAIAREPGRDPTAAAPAAAAFLVADQARGRAAETALARARACRRGPGRHGQSGPASHTEWVVLSACNTGAADDSGEGLSGLARAFFFAGAPTLLVSHWSVDDRATQTLMTHVFTRYAKDPAMPRSEALRQAMVALMSQAAGPTAYFAHPYAWAPFFLVGEGR